MKRLIKKYLPGMLLSAAIAAVAGAWLMWNMAMSALDDGPNYRKAESILRRTGLSGMEQAASHCLYMDTHFRDGQIMAVFEVPYLEERDMLYQAARWTDGWRAAEIPVADYAAWAKDYVEPCSLIRPMDDVVFDAMYYKNCFSGDLSASYFAGQDWRHLPESLGMSEIPYTTDFDVAFYDRESGLFIFYHQCM